MSVMPASSKQRGFTIVELLIVIVVIAILATISIVAYNGIQSRARTTKTLAAVSIWAKAMQLYSTETGDYPTTNSCIGNISTYGSITDASKNNGRCYGASDNGTWIVQQGLLDQMDTYLDSFPEPADYDITQGSGTSRYRGAMYYRNAASGEVLEEFRVMLESSDSCPSIGGLTDAYQSGSYSGGRMCYYRLPQ